MNNQLTINEVFETTLFKKNFHKKINEIETNRTNILRNNPGARFKASPYSSLKNKQDLTIEFMVSEFQLITDKKSILSSAERNWIAHFMNTVVTKTVLVLLNDKPKKKARKTIRPTAG